MFLFKTVDPWLTQFMTLGSFYTPLIKWTEEKLPRVIIPSKIRALSFLRNFFPILQFLICFSSSLCSYKIIKMIAWRVVEIIIVYNAISFLFRKTCFRKWVEEKKVWGSYTSQKKYKLWRRGVVVITIAQFPSTKTELRVIASSNPARSVSQIGNGENFWQRPLVPNANKA